MRATSAYSLPRDVATHVNFVAGVSRFPRYRSHRNGAPLVELAVDASSNAPLVISNHQGEGQLQLLVAPRCEGASPTTLTHRASALTSLIADGSFTNSAASPCSDAGAAISAIGVDAVSAGPYRSTVAPVSFSLPVPSAQCQQCASWTLYSSYCGMGPLLNTTVLCLMSFAGLQNYAPYNVSVTVDFDDGNSSEAYNLPLPITAFPWISIGLLRKLYNVPTGTVGGMDTNSMAVVEFLGQVCATHHIRDCSQYR